MKSGSLTLMLAAALTVGLTAASPGFAANDQTNPTAAKKMKRQVRVVQPSGDVSRPFNSCDYDRAAGRCVIDLGYGRCMECSGGPLN
jgi:hypothetical protein